MHPGALFILAALPAMGADLRGRLVPNAQLNLTSIPLASRVELDYGAANAMFDADGSFELSGVNAGRHVVRPIIPGFAVPSFIVSVPENETETPHVQTYYPDRLALSTSEASLPYPLEIAADGELNYYTPPPGMNIVQMFKSPMMLMMVFSAVMALALPKLTASLELDPETAKEFREQHKTINKMQTSAMDWSGSLSGMLAAGAAGPEGGAASPKAGSGTPSGGASRGGGPGKRGGKRK